jgi:Predicted metal-binding protein related to the C-terminal domain of SecA
MGDSSIFLSYSWKDKKLANEIDAALCAKKFNVKRDIRDIGAWKSIKEFMSAIREGDFAVLVISESYLQSPNCMFEICEVMKNPDYEKRILPVVAEDVNIYDPLVRVKFIQYWEQKSNELESKIDSLKNVNKPELLHTLRQYRQIESTVAEFLQIVLDMNNPSTSNVIESILEKLDTCCLHTLTTTTTKKIDEHKPDVATGVQIQHSGKSLQEPPSTSKPVPSKAAFTLVNTGPSKPFAISTIRQYTGMDYAKVNRIVDNLPCTFSEKDVGKRNIDNFRNRLISQGSTINEADKPVVKAEAAVKAVEKKAFVAKTDDRIKVFEDAAERQKILAKINHTPIEILKQLEVSTNELILPEVLPLVRLREISVLIDSSSNTDEKSQVRPSSKQKIGRNDPCLCGSGKKYRSCCGNDSFGSERMEFPVVIPPEWQEEIEIKVGERISQLLTPDEMDEFEKLLDGENDIIEDIIRKEYPTGNYSDDPIVEQFVEAHGMQPEGIEVKVQLASKIWLAEHCPGYSDIVKAIVNEMHRKNDRAEPWD